ncbi:phosphate ABC transporter permease PstA [Sphingomicrobium astaxanthinifaciens]|uniref:phosphate ABC transporter permease PstA n=1 Tax=Sphingomicrobium astaxanthinifaciens TaxID=1227949 RepID=UPI001FCA5882|nr:phosphate ABC transporter permease PstA [Sphingomicrobium astaxanthinifaciens]MCJ7421560.1 phosphate ABC transporter permease PstA [Sphingomicrobium astaxanthinifaciens]
MNSPREATGPARRWSSETMQKRVAARYAAERRFRLFGLVAVGISVAFLAFLLVTMAINGLSGFTRTEAPLTVDLSFTEPPREETGSRAERVGRLLADGALGGMIREAATRQYGAEATRLFADGATIELAEALVDDPDLAGTTPTLSLPVASEIDMAAKGDGSAAAEALVATVEQRAELSRAFNWTFLTASDSTDPSAVGVWGALKGSMLTILVTMALAFPIGVLSAVYLEEFAPRNRWTDMVEVSINNLAAVPSIIFGLLGLAVFLNVMHLPRSAPLVGGLTLALMTMPVIVIAGRNAIKSVPPSIRDAALGVGASRMQVVFHHVLPLALPGILTGTIIGMARALGETAPLLLIGMRAFIASPPTGITDKATVLPMQIFLWSDEVDRGFVEKTSAAIIVLLLFMLAMNALAIYLRNRFERRW